MEKPCAASFSGWWSLLLSPAGPQRTPRGGVRLLTPAQGAGSPRSVPGPMGLFPPSPAEDEDGKGAVVTLPLEKQRGENTQLVTGSPGKQNPRDMGCCKGRRTFILAVDPCTFGG